MDRDQAALAVEVSNGAELGNPGRVRRDREKRMLSARGLVAATT